mgnify:CR=1 FL=1
MSKNTKAEECTKCGELIYYNGNNPCCVEPSEEEIRVHLEELELKREQAESFVLDRFDVVSKMNAFSCAVPFEEVVDVAAHDLDFHAAIWEASTRILPNLEVQVVIDGKNRCFVSTGSSGFVEFLNQPVGMSLPIKCWIHTHPFGSAYFSGTDIRTVSIWQPTMESAYVIGGIGHYGFWEQSKPQELEICRDNKFERTQTWERRGEEE